MRTHAGVFIAEFLQDMRIAVRSLLRAPILALTILATVGLGLGATTVIFAAVDAAFFRPLPYADPDRLVRIFTDSPPNRFRLSMVDLLALEAQQTHFEKVAAYTERSMTFSDGHAAALLRGRIVSWTLRSVLVGGQFAIATPLLVAGGLLLASLDQLGRVELGFDTRNVLTGSVRLPGAQYTSAGAVASSWDEFHRRVAALPGVAGVAFADGRPPNGVSNFNNFDLEDFPSGSGQSQPVTPWVAVTPDYFGVLGLRLLEGRLLEPRDAETETLESVVVDRAWARRFFPDQSAVGKRFKSGGCSQCPWTSVVGVVSEVKYAGLDQPDAGTVYSPMGGGLNRFFVVRSHADPASLMPALRQVIRDLDPGVALTAAATVDELVAQSLQQPQSLSILVGAFAVVAIVLSIVGIYGVMTYYVQQHLKDIGIRLALGGSTSDVLRLVVGHGMSVVAAGVAAGLITALAVTRLMATLLFGVGAADTATFAGSAALMLLVALAASLVPAWRAKILQPAEILRRE